MLKKETLGVWVSCKLTLFAINFILVSYLCNAQIML